MPKPNTISLILRPPYSFSLFILYLSFLFLPVGIYTLQLEPLLELKTPMYSGTPELSLVRSQRGSNCLYSHNAFLAMFKRHHIT
ncbi:hypothetical protein ACLKA6_005561 [Drosophila palustris]